MYIHVLCPRVVIAIVCRCDHGVLNVCYSPSELEEFVGCLNCSVEGWEDVSRVSLREAARKHAPWNAFVANACKCTTGCVTRKCRCMRQGISCSSHCHGGRDCYNKKYDSR